jgi:hypothetical protein
MFLCGSKRVKTRFCESPNTFTYKFLGVDLKNDFVKSALITEKLKDKFMEKKK